jgi:hypothetical protein
VYLPESRSVGVLPVSPAAYPGALGPQLRAALADGRPKALVIRKLDRSHYRVTTTPIDDHADDGTDVIAAYKRRQETTPVDLAEAYPAIPNRQLAQLPSVAAMLPYKGIDPDAIVD